MHARAECAEYGADGTVERWVAQTLPQPDAERFQLHLLSCDRCQEAVHNATVVRAALRQPVGAPLRALRVIVPLGLAAAVATAVLWPASDPMVHIAEPGPAPEFTPVPVRTGQITSSLGDRGMEAYARRNYESAARLLDSAALVDPTPATRFFLGVSLLKTGEALRATTPLSAVVRDSVNPYAAEAALWLAKSWLSAGLADSAEVVLRELGRTSLDPRIATHAMALIDSIREARRR